MELVYLWVEEYKNIYKQGFNFSPRFECAFHDKYDKDGNLEDDCTLEINPKEHIENFFGDNINVTAIVGKNGSGKSSVLELISFLRFNRIEKITSKKVILVFKNKNNLYTICDTSFYHSFKCEVDITNKTAYGIIKHDISSEKLFQLTMFTNGLYDFTAQDENYYNLRTNFYSFYNGEHIHYKEKNNDKHSHKELNAKYAFLLKENDDFFSFLDENFLFDRMYLEIDIIREYELILYDNDEYIEQYKEINDFYNIDFGIESALFSDDNNEVKENSKKTELIYKFLSFYFLKKYIDIVIRFKHDMNNTFKENFLKKFLDYIFIAFKTKDVKEKKIIIYMAIIILTRKYFLNLNQAMKKVFKDKLGMLDDFRENTFILKYVTKFNVIVQIMEDNFIIKGFDSHKKNFLLISDTTLINYDFLEKFDNHIKKSYLLTDFYDSNIIRWEFFNQTKNYNYRKLSTGEKQLLEFIVNFAYTIKNMGYTDKSIILIEEIEISMHPQWQKKLLNIIINIFKQLNLYNNNLNYQIIFTTHSPFLLSDIPKENVIFLDTYKEKDDEVKSREQAKGNCKVVDGLKAKKQTFGANIHTLLSDSFFMDDGLMGEFAKSKINEIIDFHTIVKKERHKNCLSKIYLNSKKTKFWQIQSIVGEAYLKQILENHLIEIEKILLGKDGAKESKKERLLAQLKELDND